MCECENIEVGSYGNQVTLEAPEWSSKEEICIDACLDVEIQGLWDRGIQTTGCCCGHNKLQPYICVKDEFIDNMENLGYDSFINKFGVKCFIPKTI